MEDQISQFNKEKDFKEFNDFLNLKELAESTIREYNIRYKIFPVDNITPETVKSFLLDNRGNVPRAFVRNYLEFRQIYDIRIPVRSGRKKIRLPEKLTLEEIRRLRYALYKRGIKYGVMFDIARDSAIRRTELVSLTPSMFDWDLWKIDTTKPCRAKIIGKGNKERQIIISSDTARRLKDYLKPYIKAGVILMNSKIFDITPKHWWKILIQESEKTLGKRIRPHAIRHSTSTEMYESGKFDLLDLQRYLGHASLSTTQLYIHADEEKSIQKFEDFFEKKN